MAHHISGGPRPEIVIMKLDGALTYEDMTCTEEIGLHERKLYVLLDAGDMEVSLPADFLDGARESWFTHANMLHVALYTRSMLLSTVGKAVAKLTRRNDKLSSYTSYDQALAHLIKLAERDAQSSE
jgi:hypothetical protein